jgi:hypothetical protein
MADILMITYPDGTELPYHNDRLGPNHTFSSCRIDARWSITATLLDGELHGEVHLIHENDRRSEVFHYDRGKIHRDDAPAYENFYQDEWFHRGHRHRLDGPALCPSTGGEPHGWYIHGHVLYMIRYDDILRRKWECERLASPIPIAR